MLAREARVARQRVHVADAERWPLPRRMSGKSAETCVHIRQFAGFKMWLWVKNMVTPKWNPGKWKQGLKPAVAWWLILTHTHVVREQRLRNARLAKGQEGYIWE